jgi:carboxymethylenebutenolidase
MAIETQEKRLTAQDFPQEVLDLFDGYVHGRLDRRGFIESASRYTMGAAGAAAMFEALRPQYARAQQVPASDSRVRNEYVEYPSPRGAGTMRGYLSRPANATGRQPGVLVIHENRGLNPYIEDVVRRFGAANFIALGPDALTPLGGYPGNDDEGRTLQSQRDGAEMIEDFIAGAEWLMNHPDCTSRVGAVGFCYGGGVVNTLAVRLPNLGAGAPFYGRQPAAADVPKINAPLLIHNASLDTGINQGWPAFEEALKANNKTYTMHMYENANHGFHNDTTPRYDEAAAKLAQERTIAFFNEHLR